METIALPSIDKGASLDLNQRWLREPAARLHSTDDHLARTTPRAIGGRDGSDARPKTQRRSRSPHAQQGGPDENFVCARVASRRYQVPREE